MEKKNIKQRVSKIEILIIAIILINLPVFFIARNYFKNDFITYNISFEITVVIIQELFLVLGIIQLIFKREYFKILFGCHGRSDRSSKCVHKHFGICMRCFGIFIGILLSPLIILTSISSLYFLMLAIPLLVDGLIQHFTNYNSNNIKRFFSGVLFAPTVIISITAYCYFITKLITLFFGIFN